MVNKDVQDEAKLIKILEFVDFIGFGEHVTSCYFGEENVDWKYEANGDVTLINELLPAVKGAGGPFTQFVLLGKTYEAQTFQPIYKAGAEYYADLDSIWSKHLKKPGRMDLFEETGYTDLMMEIRAGLQGEVSEFYSDAVMGNVDIEKEWDAYLKRLDDQGYQQMIDEIAKMPTYDELLAKAK